LRARQARRAQWELSVIKVHLVFKAQRERQALLAYKVRQEQPVRRAYRAQRVRRALLAYRAQQEQPVLRAYKAQREPRVQPA
jgi:hypothetical protein